MRYAGLIENDFANGEGVCVTVFLQGCPHHCEGCHNPETWDFNGGNEIDENEFLSKIVYAISKNGIQRNLSISGGDPLCNNNIPIVKKIIETVKEKYPTIKIFCWTGYEYIDLFSEEKYSCMNSTSCLYYILNNIDVLITGPFIQSKRDITLHLRGSSNQEIWRRIDNRWILDKK